MSDWKDEFRFSFPIFEKLAKRDDFMPEPVEEVELLVVMFLPIFVVFRIEFFDAGAVFRIEAFEQILELFELHFGKDVEVNEPTLCHEPIDIVGVLENTIESITVFGAVHVEEVAVGAAAEDFVENASGDSVWVVYEIRNLILL